MLNETEGNRALPKAQSVLFVWEHCRKSLPSSSSSYLCPGVLQFKREPLLAPQDPPAPSEFSYFRAQLFPPGLSTPTYCRVHTSGSRLGQRAAPAALGVSAWRESPRFSSESWLWDGIQEEGNRLGFSLPSGCSQVPGSRWGSQAFCLRPLELGSRSQLPSGCHLVTPGCSQHSSSISVKGGSCLAWCFCKQHFTPSYQLGVQKGAGGSSSLACLAERQQSVTEHWGERWGGTSHGAGTGQGTVDSKMEERGAHSQGVLVLWRRPDITSSAIPGAPSGWLGEGPGKETTQGKGCLKS